MYSNDFDVEYENEKYIFDRASRYIEEDLKNLLEDLKDKYKGVFIAEVEKPRIKKLDSLRRKALRNEIPLQMKEIAKKVNDIIGIRITSNSIVGVKEITEHIKNFKKFKVIDDDDKILFPDDELGYRARHIIIEYEVFKGIDIENVLCEIQIRTYLQDAYAKIVHDDIYKHPEEMDPFIYAMSKVMSDLLHIIDTFGDRIVKEAQRKIKSRNIEGKEINKTNLSYIYFEKFKYYPDDFTLQKLLNYFREFGGEIGINSIGKAKEYLADEITKEKFNLRHKRYFPKEKGISMDDFLIFGTIDKVEGTKVAFNKYKKMLVSRLNNKVFNSKTIEDFIDLFSNNNEFRSIVNNLFIKTHFKYCTFCTNAFIDTKKVSKDILDYYKQSDDKYGLLSIMQNSFGKGRVLFPLWAKTGW